MSLIKKEIQEIRSLIKEFKAGKITAEQVNSMMTAYSQIEKRIGHQLKAMALASQFSKRNFNLPIETGLIDDTRIIEIEPGETQQDQIKCDHQGRWITRKECLETSGNPNHEVFDYCHAGCEQNERTRKLLLPELPGRDVCAN